MQTEELASIARLGARLSDHGLPYRLGGSALLYALDLLGSLDEVAVMLHPADLKPARDATQAWWQGEGEGMRGRWRTRWIAHLDVDGVHVDLLGGLAFDERGHLVRVPMRLGGAWVVAGTVVPLADPAAWWLVYRQWQPERASLLQSVLSPAARRAVLEEVGLRAG
jgi:hypothetical protein